MNTKKIRNMSENENATNSLSLCTEMATSIGERLVEGKAKETSMNMIFFVRQHAQEKEIALVHAEGFHIGSDC